MNEVRLSEEEIYNECLDRMTSLKLSKKCIEEFKKGNIWESEGIGALYELEPEEKKIVEDFERTHEGYRVYHVIHSIHFFGEVYNLLFVGPYQEDLVVDRRDIKDLLPIVYAYNKTCPECTDMGTINVACNIGGLIRTDSEF